MHRPCYTPHKHYFSASDTHFCYMLREPHCLARLEGLDKLKKFVSLIRFRTRDLPACSIVPQPLCYCLSCIFLYELFMQQLPEEIYFHKFFFLLK
jgi:hypothetical protein